MPYEPVLLANIHKPNSHTLAVYEAGGGYQGLRRALKQMSPKDVVEQVKSSGLRGRGGAGFPTGLKWSFLPEKHAGPVYLCVNADESEPGTFVNRVQMELDPHQVLEGIILSCYATRASTAYVYLRYEYPLCRRRMQAAIDECYAAGYLGKNILGSGFSLDVFIHRGAAAYVCGEETGLIESIEGRRAWPRIKPPFPAVEGLFRKPTVVNNVETLACVKHIVDRGVAWFRSMGTPPEPGNARDPGSFGPKLYGLSGHVNRPGCYEAPLGITVSPVDRRVRRRRVEGPPGEGRGSRRLEHGRDERSGVGYAAGFFRPDEGRLPGPGHGLRGGVGRDLLDGRFPAQQLPFLRSRELRPMYALPRGDALGLQMMDRIKAGRGRLKDLDLLLEIGDSIGIIPGTTICGLADGAAWPMKNAIRKFRDEFEDFIKQTNPQGYMEMEPVEALVSH